MKILIAEDDLISSKILQKNLLNWGYLVVTARSGAEAWEALQDQELRMALLDWMMPGIDGIEVCRKIRRRKKYKYTYIIILSAKDRRQDIITGLSSGADDYMTKPVDFLELRARLQTGRRIIDLEDKLLAVQRQLKDIASRDGLTKIWNRSETTKFLTEELDRGKREGVPTGVILLDIDHFKRINDFYGHDIGDQALLQVVSRIKRKIRKSDKIGRYGGDEIMIILPRCSSSKIIKVAERLRQSVAKKGIKKDLDKVLLTISAGCASTDVAGILSAEKFIKVADEALLKAKRQGRNCHIVANGISSRSQERNHV
ncbi:MAG: diguanylate cyclase [Candidatus Aminicenantales bacterium]